MKKFLLDTHILLWWLMNDSALKSDARALIDDPNIVIVVSVVNVWEMGIKQALGQFRMPDDLFFQIKSNAMHILPVTIEHAYAVRSLPRLHGDPFDRMLVVQAMLEDLTLLTHDRKLGEYSISCMVV